MEKEASALLIRERAKASFRAKIAAPCTVLVPDGIDARRVLPIPEDLPT